MSRKLAFVLPVVGGAAGGVFTAVVRLCEILAGQFELFLIGEDGGEPLPSNVRLVPVKHSRIFGNYKYSPHYLKALNSVRPDIVHVHGLWNFHSLAGYLYARQNPSVRLIVSPHGMLDPWILRRSRGLKWIVSHLCEKALIRRASAVHVLTDREADDVRRFSRNPAVSIIPNPAPAVHGHASLSGSERWRMRQVVFLGRLHEKKGIVELQEAWAALPESQRKSWSLDIYGFGDEALIHGRLGEGIRYHGPVFGEAKETVLLNATLVILPSKSEGLPMGVLEAWAYGIPTLMTDACNLPIGFQRGAARCITLDNLAHDLSKALSGFADEHVWRSHSIAARNLVAEKFSGQIVADAFTELYKGVLA